MGIGCLSLVTALVLMLIMPLMFADLMQAAFEKLQVSQEAAALIVIGILLGSLINLPVKRIKRSDMVPVDPLAVLGLRGRWRPTPRLRAETVVAVNVGGCLIPASLAAYEVLRLVAGGAARPLLVAVSLNVIVCYLLARPVKGVGILMPGFVPPLVAALSAAWLAPAHSTPVAFVAGTLGPLVGADLLHLRQVERMETGIVSIGGAGTFDGILLSGILALYLS